MSTRGTIEVNGKFYVIGHDAYTSYALPRLKLAAKLGSLSKFLSKVHEMLDVYEKPTPKYSKFLGSFGMSIDT